MSASTTWEIAAAGLHDLADEFGGVTVRNLLDRGFDIQNGNLLHNGMPIAPSYVAPDGGPVPAPLGPAVVKERVTLSAIYERAWNKWFSNAIKPGGLSTAYQRLSPLEQNALESGTSSDGGYLVAPTTASGILSRMAAASVVRQRATVVPTLTRSLVLPAFTANSSSPSTYVTDYLAQWGPEKPVNVSATDPSIEAFEISVKKAFSGLLRIQSDLAEDAPGAIGFVVDAGAKDLALVTEAGILAGTGFGLQPRGVLNSGITEVDVEGSTSNTISNTALATGSAPKMAALVAAVPAQYRRSAAMVASSTGEANIMTLIDGDGARMYKRGDRVEGLNLEISPFMEADGTDANRPVLVGDLSAVLIAQRSIATYVIRLPEHDQVGVVLIERLGSGVWDTNALRLGVV